jgi:hypothetical protein
LGCKKQGLDSRSRLRRVGNDTRPVEISNKKPACAGFFISTSAHGSAAVAALKLGLGVELAAGGRRGVGLGRGGHAGGKGGNEGSSEHAAKDFGHGNLLRGQRK